MEEDSSEMGTLQLSQKEKERERRRMRDRQRRESMSAEERSQHLARRRRNYQLRRQRAENAMLVPQFEQGTTQDQHEPLIEAIVVSDDQAHDVKSEMGLKLPPHILAMLPRRPRLTHFKHIARSLNEQAGKEEVASDNHRLQVDVLVKDGESNCVSAKAVRLNSIKRLARGLNSTVTQSADQNHQSEGKAKHVNVGSGKEVTIKELAELVKEVVGFEGELVWDSSKPNGTPKEVDGQFKDCRNGVELKDGLVDTYKWYLENVQNIKK